ncbi:cysteine-rich CWC family protein [uncultured Psychromonas sp.]|uniref:cysteine-rich CWC family protein n=1 Tax=uncultured Psychromonas sp. TaxID=173974 RepID=UPI00260D4936|nr:cysteine-rich CWC family protein [uncultured Psychromonas sp.]
MDQTIDDKACPFCFNDNQCDVANNCWCKVLEVPTKLLQLVPANLKHKTCICNSCVISFNHDPALFIKNREDKIG